jgi:hypothetical protein
MYFELNMMYGKSMKWASIDFNFNFGINLFPSNASNVQIRTQRIAGSLTILFQDFLGGDRKVNSKPTQVVVLSSHCLSTQSNCYLTCKPRKLLRSWQIRD